MIITDLLGDYLDEILKNTNIVNIVGKTVDLKKTEKDYVGECPFCNGKKFVVSESKQMYHCFDCEKGGNLLTFIEDMKFKGKRSAVDELNDKPYFKKSFEILNEIFPECTDEQRRKLFSVIQSLLIMKVMELTNNKSYVSYRDNGRFLKEFRFLCEFIKSEQDTQEDIFR